MCKNVKSLQNVVLNDTGYILEKTLPILCLMQFLGHNNCDIWEVNTSN